MKRDSQRPNSQGELAICARVQSGINESGNGMDAPKVEQSEGETAESKPVGKWWHGAIAGGVAGVISLIVGGWTMDGVFLYLVPSLLAGVFISGFIGGSLGGLLARRWGKIASLVLGGIFGLPAMVLFFNII